MNIGLLGNKNNDASKMTDEIERAAEAERVAVDGQGDFERLTDLNGTEGPSSEVFQGIGSAALGQIGEGESRRAIFGPEQKAGEAVLPAQDTEKREASERAREVAESNIRIKEMVAAENGYVQNGLEAGANVVGGESRKEIRERLKDDREDLKVETGEGWGHEIMARGQERLTKETVHQIDRIIKNNAYKPADLERQRFLGMNAILRTYGRVFGDRN